MVGPGLNATTDFLKRRKYQGTQMYRTKGMLRQQTPGQEVKVKLTLHQAYEDPDGVLQGSLALLFNLGARWGVVNATPRPLYPQEKDSVPIVQEAGWAPELVWTSAEKLPHTGI